MSKQILRPSKDISRFSFFIGILFSIIGFILIIGTFFTPMTSVSLPFTIVWTAIAIYNTYIAYKNGFTEEGIGIYEIKTTSDNTENTLNFEEKLRKIEKLKMEGLISESEYNQKREEVMKEKW